MNFDINTVYHVYNRGNNREQIFSNRENYIFFLKKLRLHLLPVCDLLSYCLMPNHFHFMIYTKDSYMIKDKHPINQSISTILSSYTQAYNKQQNRTGSLFQQKSKAINVSEKNNKHSDYSKTCFHYIHQNPMKAMLIVNMEDWEFSSFRDYVGLRNGTLCNRKLAHQILDITTDANELFKLSYEVIDDNLFEV